MPGTQSGGRAAEAYVAQDFGWAGMARLRRRLNQGIRQARHVGASVIVSVAGRVSGLEDPVAVVAAARRSDDAWFCLQQPRGAVASLGCVRRLEASGGGRFAALEADWRRLTAAAIADDLVGPSGSGLAAFGGFAFAPEGGAAPHWRGFAPSSLMVPELSLVRGNDGTWLTINAELGPDDLVEERLRGLLQRLRTLRPEPLPLLDPLPTGRYEVVSAMPPAHYEETVKVAVRRIRSGEFDKVVLAREVDVHAPAPYDPSAILGVARDAYSSSYVYAVGRGDTTFIGATPELLIRSEGQRVSTVALAGSTRRSADPAVDDHLGERLLHSDKDRHENAIVARRIIRALGPYSLWVTGADEVVVVKVANIQHLALPIRAQLAEPMDALKLVGLLHPTPAVGAEPRSAVASIPGLEGFDRGWYAGGVGWTDAAGDGEFCVALRCALLAGPLARCYAGCGIVADSDPVAELAESEVKLQVMLPALTG